MTKYFFRRANTINHKLPALKRIREGKYINTLGLIRINDSGQMYFDPFYDQPYDRVWYRDETLEQFQDRIIEYVQAIDALELDR